MANQDENQRSLLDLFASLRTSAESTAAPAPSHPSFTAAPYGEPRPSHGQQRYPPSNAPAMPQSHSNVPGGAHALSEQPPSQGNVAQTMSHGPLDASSGGDRTANLLNLLRQGSDKQDPTRRASGEPSATSFPATTGGSFNFSSGVPTASRPTPQLHGRGVSASDLVASFMGRPSAPESPREALSPQPVAQPTNANPQDFLLQLLNQGTPSDRRTPQPPAVADTSDENKARVEQVDTSQQYATNGTPSSRQPTPIRVFGTSSSREPTPFDPTDMPPMPAGTPQERAEAPAPPSTTTFTPHINPFDQLAASSPRNTSKSGSGRGTPKNRPAPPHPTSRFGSKTDASGSGRSSNEEAVLGNSKGKEELTSKGDQVLQSIETEAPSGRGDGRSKVEELLGIGAPTENAETVTQALNDVGEKVNRQVEEALAEGDSDARAVDTERKAEKNIEEQAIQEQLQDTAAEVKREIDGNGGEEALEEVLTKPMAQAVQKVLDEAAAGNVEGNHGSADDEDSSWQADEDFVVPVFNFPMKPFVSIELKKTELPQLQFRETIVTDIARMKKDFDQLDRTLVTASNDYIVYAMPKPGYRVLRQDDGHDRQLFKETKDRTFNVAISSAPRSQSQGDLEACIGTAVSGAVHWSAIRLFGEDIVASNEPGNHCLTFPPPVTYEEHVSTGQLKTRAKRSSRHPKFFAIGRGRYIHIIFPFPAMLSKHVGPHGVIDTDKYFSERRLRVNTGKACKDFTFSEDDTIVATIEKAGLLRFWDVRDLVDDAHNEPGPMPAIEVDAPMLSYLTTLPTEKSSPTSVLFVDKSRAYSKGSAMRYLILGLNQNHTLQLWDLGLGKAVQELCFPHEHDDDAICSVAYHAPSGIVAVGHPTRNSIYLVHLSAPKYNLQSYSQARYVQKLANKDNTLPKPESTAILSGMREYSFAFKGQLRSIDLLPVTSEIAANKADPGLFELYVMHSRGVTCLNIHKTDLGWGEDSKIVDSRSAETTGLVEVKELRESLAAAISEASTLNGGDSKPSAKAPTKVGSNAKSTREARDDSKGGAETEGLQASNLPNGSQTEKRAERRRKKKGAAESEEITSSVPPPAPAPPKSHALTSTQNIISLPSQEEREPSSSKTIPSVSVGKSKTSEAMTDTTPHQAVNSASVSSFGISSETVDDFSNKLNATFVAELTKALGQEFGELYRKIDEDKRVQSADHLAKQEAILHVVSESLNENVDRALNRIILAQINQIVIPSIHNVTATTLRKEMPEWLSKNLLAALPAQMRLALPEAVSKAMQTQDILRYMSEQVTQRFAAAIEKPILAKLQNEVLPQFQKMTLDATRKQVGDAEERLRSQLKAANLQNQQYGAKIDELTDMVRALQQSLQSAASQPANGPRQPTNFPQQATRVPNYSDTDQSSGDERTLRQQAVPQAAPQAPAQARSLMAEQNHIAELLSAGQFEPAMLAVSFP